MGKESFLQEMHQLEGQAEEEEEEEYVLLDLDNVSKHIDIPLNVPYIISGLDTLNPIMTIDNKIKLVGEYEETIGTCLLFNESEASPVVHQETGQSDANLFSGVGIIDPQQPPEKTVKGVARLHKVLKFNRILEDSTNGDAKQPAKLVID